MIRSKSVMRVGVIGALCLSAGLLVGCSKSVSGDSITSEVSRVLTEQTGVTYVVTCPDSVDAKTGTAFTCTAVDPDGASSTISAQMTDDNGAFSITGLG